MEGDHDLNKPYLGTAARTGEVEFLDSENTYYLHKVQTALNLFLHGNGYQPLAPSHMFNYVSSRKFTAWVRTKHREFNLFIVNRTFGRNFKPYLTKALSACLRFSMGEDAEKVKIIWDIDNAHSNGFRLDFYQKTGKYSYLEIVPMKQGTTPNGDMYEFEGSITVFMEDENGEERGTRA